MHLASVPLIRLFGATDKGQRVVAHVHGVFPYLYVKYKGKLDPESGEHPPTHRSVQPAELTFPPSVAVNAFIVRFGRKLNQAVAFTFKDNQDPSKPKRPAQHIAFIVVCKGTPFYGYSVGFDVFLKVYLTQPSLKKRTAELLRNGAILNTRYDVSVDLGFRELLCSHALCRLGGARRASPATLR